MTKLVGLLMLVCLIVIDLLNLVWVLWYFVLGGCCLYGVLCVCMVAIFAGFVVIVLLLSICLLLMIVLYCVIGVVLLRFGLFLFGFAWC